MRCNFWLVALFAVGSLTARAAMNGSYNVSGGSVSFSENSTTHLVTATFALMRRDDGSEDPDNYYTGFSVIRTDANGSNTNLGIIFNESSVQAGWGASPWTVTGSLQFTRTTSAWYRVRVYKTMDVGNVVVENNVAWILPDTVPPEAQSAPATALKSKPLNVTNTFTRPLVVNYRDKVTGELLYTTTLAGGETAMFTFQNPNGNDVTVDYALPEGAVFKSTDQTGAIQFFSYSPGTTWAGSDMTSGTDFSATPPTWQAATSSSPAPAVSSATATTAPTAVNPAANAASGVKAVGGKTNIVYTTNVSDGAVTDKTVREGNSGIVDKLDSVQRAIEAAKDADKAERDAESVKAAADEEARTTATAGGVSGGTAAKAQAQGLFTGSAPTAPSIESGTSNPLAVQMPAAFGGATFSFNPFAGDRFGAVMSWFRTATQWVVLVALGAWLWAQIDIKTVQATAMQQAKGNPVAAGTGGQVTALVAAAAITVAVVGLMTALLAWSWGDLTITYLTSLASTNPMVSIPSGVLWMLNQALPVSTIITAFVAKVSWRFYSVPLFAGAAAVVRFVVP